MGRLAPGAPAVARVVGGRELSASPLPSAGVSAAGIDVARARAATPGCHDVVHLNNAGAALPTRHVLDTVIDHLELEARVGGYAAADAVADRSNAVYDSVATLLGAHRDEIALMESATRAWDMAFYAVAARFEPGDVVVTSRSEYVSNALAFLQVARRTGLSVEVLPDDEHGAVDVDALRERLERDPPVRLVAVSWIPTQGGLVNPAAAVGALARAAGVPYLLDACQAVGQLPVDVEALGCDFLSATGRKYLRAPRGTGLLYVRRPWIEALDPPFVDVHAARWTSDSSYELRADARRFESFEHGVAGRLGLGAAVDEALAWGADAIATRVLALGEALRGKLAAVPRLALRDLGQHRCGIVTFTIEGVDPFALAAALRERHVNISVSTIDFARLDFESRGLDAVARASVHYYNTDDELDRLVDEITSITRT
ncbi:MAG TPA: aminotransferase class V-fold PLP-dependent enzyme [Acidimicrobiia bacterium]|nr:aminotransferase class V-fold PLP-dependent enzyme [Acidimicrobiia bacterium]